MRAYRRLSVRLSKRDRKELRQLPRKGIQPVRAVLRALTLLQLDASQTASEVARHMQLTSKAVREIGPELCRYPGIWGTRVCAK